MARILLVEDDDEIAGLVQILVESQSDHKIARVETGREAFERIDDEAFDIMLLDWMMPGMSGLQVIQRLREAENDIYIIVVTALTKDYLIEEALKAGADDFLSKPFEPNVLLLRLQVAEKFVKLRTQLRRIVDGDVEL
jgi:DNA-binding response OmpR family regulator